MSLNSLDVCFTFLGLPGGSDGKESACNVGDPGSIPGLGRSPGEGNGNPLQYSCLENPTVREAWQATAHRVVKSRKPPQLLFRKRDNKYVIYQINFSVT